MNEMETNAVAILRAQLMERLEKLENLRKFLAAFETNAKIDFVKHSIEKLENFNDLNALNADFMEFYNKCRL